MEFRSDFQIGDFSYSKRFVTSEIIGHWHSRFLSDIY